MHLPIKFQIKLFYHFTSKKAIVFLVKRIFRPKIIREGRKIKRTTELAREIYRKSGGADIKKERLGGAEIVRIEMDGRRYLTAGPSNVFKACDQELLCGRLSEYIENLLPDGPVIVVGIGNISLTPDSLGPKVAGKICCTGKNAVKGLRDVAAFIPGVGGVTGIESLDVSVCAAYSFGAAAVIAVDAIAAKSAKNLGCIQISSAGIKNFSKSGFGVPVIGVGAATVLGDDRFLITKKDIDVTVTEISEILARSINMALNPVLYRG